MTLEEMCKELLITALNNGLIHLAWYSPFSEIATSNREAEYNCKLKEVADKLEDLLIAENFIKKEN